MLYGNGNVRLTMQSVQPPLDDSHRSDYWSKYELWAMSQNLENDLANRDSSLTAAKVASNAAMAHIAATATPISHPNETPAARAAREANIAAANDSRLESDNAKVGNLLIWAQEHQKDLALQKKAMQDAAFADTLSAEAMYGVGQKLQHKIESKSQVVYINNAAAKNKAAAIRSLAIAIYFLLYMIGAGVAVATGVISFKSLSYLFFAGLLIAAILILTSGGFFKSYGDYSIDIAKGGVRGLIDVFGEEKSCPKRCIRKGETIGKGPIAPCGDDDDTCWLGKSGEIPGYQFRTDRPFNMKKFYRDLDQGKTPTRPHTCVWTGNDCPPNNLPVKFDSEYPCRYLYQYRDYHDDDAAFVAGCM